MKDPKDIDAALEMMKEIADLKLLLEGMRKQWGQTGMRAADAQAEVDSLKRKLKLLQDVALSAEGFARACGDGGPEHAHLTDACESARAGRALESEDTNG